MGYEVPRRYNLQIEQVAFVQGISTDEALERIIQVGVEKLLMPGSNLVPDYLAILDRARQSPNCFKSREEVDAYMSELRDEW